MAAEEDVWACAGGMGRASTRQLRELAAPSGNAGTYLQPSCVYAAYCTAVFSTRSELLGHRKITFGTLFVCFRKETEIS